MPRLRIVVPDQLVRLAPEVFARTRLQFRRVFRRPDHHVLCRAFGPAAILMPLEIVRMRLRRPIVRNPDPDPFAPAAVRQQRSDLGLDDFRLQTTRHEDAKYADLVAHDQAADYSSKAALNTPLKALETTTEVHTMPLPVPAWLRSVFV